MHRFRGWCFGWVLLLALAAPVVAAESADDLPSVAKTLSGRAYSGAWFGADPPLLSDWDKSLAKQLSSLDPPQAIVQLAKQYQLPLPVMRGLARIWIFANTRPASGGLRSRLTPALKMRLISLVRKSGHAPLLLEASNYLLWHDGCGDPYFVALLKNAPDPASVAWQGMVQTECYSWWLYARQHFPELETPALWRMLFDGKERPGYAVRLTLTGVLLRPEQMKKVPVAERSMARTALISARLEALLDLGLSKKAVALYDGAPPDIQAALLMHRPETMLHVAGRALRDESPYAPRSYVLPLAGAMYLAGDRDRAAKLFDTLPKLAAMRRYGTCRWVSGRKCEGMMPYKSPQMAVLDGLLHPGNRTPYQIAESYFYRGTSMSYPGLDADLNCAFFTATGVRPLCAVSHSDAARQFYRADHPDKIFARALVKADPQSEAEADAALRRFALKNAGEGVPPFNALPLPAAFAGHTPLHTPYIYRFRSILSADPEDKAAPKPHILRTLPWTFQPLRWEQQGKRITVVSASDAYEDGFSVSRGGYWVNISSDGGESWQRPLYTGLQVMLPYQIVTDSKMPLVAGDALDIEVDKISLAGKLTSPVWYGVIRRDIPGFYLHIPLSELRRDSDGDGITDLAEKRLLLDPHNPDSDGDGLADGEDAMPNVKAGTGSALARALIGHVYRVRKPGTGRVPPSAVSNPVMVFGNPADFAGVRPTRMFLVYPEAELKRVDPFGQLSHLSPVIRNRDGTRGFLEYYSSGGGFTQRARRVHGKWLFDILVNWIS